MTPIFRMACPPPLPVIRVLRGPDLLKLPLVGLIIGIGGQFLSLPCALPGTLTLSLAAVVLIFDAVVGNNGNWHNGSCS
jgi:hypothetical protein